MPNCLRCKKHIEAGIVCSDCRDKDDAPVFEDKVNDLNNLMLDDENDLSQNEAQGTSLVHIHSILPTCEKSFADLFGVEAEKYEGVLINMSELSVRVNNRLRHIGAETFDQLLKYSPADLMRIESFGKNSLKEISKYIEKFIDHYEVVDIPKNDQPGSVLQFAMTDETKQFVVDHVAELEKGEYQQLIDQCGEDHERIALLQYFIEHHEEMDYSLLLLVLREPEKAVDLCRVLNRSISYLSFQKRIQEAVDHLPAYKRQNLTVNYISAYEWGDTAKETLSRIYDLDHPKLENALWNPAVNEDNIDILLRFLKWCAFDLNKEISEALASMFDKER